MSGVGKQILENVMAVVPLGIDPAQMRGQVDVPPPVAPEKKDDVASEATPTEISQSMIRTFQTFYIEKKFEDAAKVIQDAIGAEKVEGTVLEALKAEWSKELLEQATKLNFLRGAMPKFSGFITAATDKWTALDEKEKEAAVEYLKRIGKKMTTDLKGRIEGLAASSDSAEVMMLAMMVYMFGVGISGEGHMKPAKEGEGAAASA